MTPTWSRRTLSILAKNPAWLRKVNLPLYEPSSARAVEISEAPRMNHLDILGMMLTYANPSSGRPRDVAEFPEGSIWRCLGTLMRSEQGFASVASP